MDEPRSDTSMPGDQHVPLINPALPLERVLERLSARVRAQRHFHDMLSCSSGSTDFGVSIAELGQFYEQAFAELDELAEAALRKHRDEVGRALVLAERSKG